MFDNLDTNDIRNWSLDNVAEWLKSIDFGEYVNEFRKQKINGQALIMLNEDDIKQLMTPIGDRKNFFFNVKTLQALYTHENLAYLNRELSLNDSMQKHDTICESCLKNFEANKDPITELVNLTSDLKSEKFKTFVSFLYLILSSLWTSFTLTIVHDRVPDMQKFPPLPDIILDSVPLMHWAFYGTEIIGLILVVLMLIVLYFHKFRFIIFRRICSLAATIFLIRSFTMLITSLSVPGIHIQCASQRYGSLANKLNGAWNILTGCGLSINGLRTCGDYMFSGHTVWLTLLTHFICEYTPYTFNWLHTIVWIMNLFGLFFILAAHEHYSIDVFIGFYITSRMFLYYHSLSTNKALFQNDNRRVKIWFPLFSYFEANIHSQVPNQYENPVKKFFKRLFKKILKKSKAS